MNKIKKILLFVIVLLFLVGIASATDVQNESSSRDIITTHNTDITNTNKVVQDTSTLTDNVQENTLNEKKIIKIEEKNLKATSQTYEVNNSSQLITAMSSDNEDVIININSNITLAANQELNDSIKNLTINGNNYTLSGNGRYQFLNISNQIVNINQLIIADCYDTDGEAIYNNGNLVITDSTLRNNYASYYGGAITNNGGTVTITSSTFTQNTTMFGGAIFKAISLTITNSTFTENRAAQDGEAVYIEGTNLTINGSTFTQNTAKYGGLIYNQLKSGSDEKSNVTLFNSDFIDNTAQYGAVIYNYQNTGLFNITHNLFKNNTANDNETLNLGEKNEEKILEQNTYENTDIIFKTNNITIQNEKTTYQSYEEVKLNFITEIDYPDNYDNDILEKINKTLYINNEKNITTKYDQTTITELQVGKNEVYLIICNQQSNTITYTVIGNSKISTPDESYEYYSGVNNEIPLIITNPSREKGTLDLTVKDQDKYKRLSS